MVAQHRTQLRQVNEQLLAEIAERQQVEAALRKSESVYRTLIETIPYGIQEIDTDGFITFCNSAYERMLGYAPGELLGKPMWDLAPEAERLHLPGYLAMLVQDQPPPTPYLGKTLTKDGKLIDIQVDWNYKRDNQGQVTGFISVITDITERQQAQRAIHQLNQELELRFQQRTADLEQANEQLRREVKERQKAEEALRASEARLQAIVLHSYDIITLTDEHDNISYQNQSTHCILGYLPEELSSQRPVHKVHPEDIAKVQFAQAEILEKPGVPVRVEYRMQRADGSWAWLQSIGTNWLANPNIRAIVANTRDISDRKLAEEALRKAHDELEIRVQERTAQLTRINESLQAEISDRKLAEEALRMSQHFIKQITDTTPTLLYIYDLNQDCHVYANRQTEAFFGYTQLEIQAMGRQLFAEVCHPDDFQHLAEYIKRLALAKDGEVIEKEFRMKNAQGEWHWLHSREVVFTRNSDGKPKQILGTAVNITELKQAEEMCLALEKEKELSQLQRRFFSMVSHEFRTPISSILVSAQSLEQSYERWSKNKIIKNIKRIQACAIHTIDLLEDIFTINNAETGKLEVNTRLLDLEKLCRNLVEDVQLIFGNLCKITFVSHCNCHKTYMDEKLLRSILENLLTNAIKYSPPGSSVYFSLGCDQGQAIFQIRDEGIGIPPEDLPRLFEPFHRGKNVENIPGTGLGITVVKKCLDVQRGKIVLDSKVGVGTTVTVTIPHR